MTTKLTAAQRFLKDVKPAEAEIADVTAPSGFVYQFEKPSRAKLLFGFSELPQMLAAGAVKDWTVDGLLEGLNQGDTDIVKVVKAALDLRDRVIELSHSPKLVKGSVFDPAKDELSVERLPDGDLDFLLAWVASGGELSRQAGLSTFPEGLEPGPVANFNRAQRRAAAKSTGGARPRK